MRRVDPIIAATILLIVCACVAGDRLLARTTYLYPGGRARIVRGTVVSKAPPLSAWEALRIERRGEIMQHLEVRTPDGVLTADNPVTGSPVADRIPDVGDEVLLQVRDLGSESYATLRDIARDRQQAPTRPVCHKAVAAKHLRNGRITNPVWRCTCAISASHAMCGGALARNWVRFVPADSLLRTLQLRVTARQGANL